MLIGYRVLHGNGMNVGKKESKGVTHMTRGYKSAFTDKRQDQHIADSYEERGVSHIEAEKRAWATVNQESNWWRQEDPLRSGSPREPLIGAQGWSAWWRGICN